jgi:large subunit ribosomal protein L22
MAKTATKENKATKTKASAKAAAPVRKEVRASARFLRLSPRKARLVTNLVKNMYAMDAVAQLQFVNKKAAPIVSDLIKSAIANAENNFNLKREDLFIQSLTADSGPRLKRYMPRAQGRATEIRRPLSHLNIVLEVRGGAGAKSSKRKFSLAMDDKKKSPGKTDEAKTAKEDAADEKNAPAMRNQADKTQQDMKNNKVQNKRRMFNRKSGV